MAKIIAISGGIGCGKTVVSTILRYMGYIVYDCDNNAKILMDNSDFIKKRIESEISPDAIVNNSINRQVLGKIVFKDKNILNSLNQIVHGAVKEDISLWIADNSGQSIIFIETAILYQSGIDKLVDEVWEVSAPVDIRIDRVIKRNNTTKDDVINRIKSQQIEITKRHCNIKKICNDGKSPILPQILNLLS